MSGMHESNMGEQTGEEVDQHIGDEDYTIYMFVLFIIATFYLVASQILSSSRVDRNLARKASLKGK